MTPWQEFYQNIRDPSWPECATEEDFAALPETIQRECQEVFGYQPGEFRKRSQLINKSFPIRTDTACQLKWTWSTIYLTTGQTASCHRTNHHEFDFETFDFHNTPSKIQDRERMLQGEWPTKGCDYCRNIESAGGQSDRLTNLDFPGIHAPLELEQDTSATRVTPRMLEVYFDNTCNLKCLYCGPYFSSAWDAENKQHGYFARDGLIISDQFHKSQHLDANKHRIFDWLRLNGHQLAVFNVLGGEPLYQQELLECLDVFEQHPAPNLKLQIFSNLKIGLPRLQAIITRIRGLIERDCLREFEVTASLDCWGEPQEYVRYPLDLRSWQENFEYLLSQPWINLIINSTITPLTVRTLPDLLERINTWSAVRPIYHYQNSVNSPSYMFIDIFGDLFRADFERALQLKPDHTPEQKASRLYLDGIARQSVATGPNQRQIRQLWHFLNEIDRRRHTSWPRVFPWLVDEFARYGLTIGAQ